MSNNLRVVKRIVLDFEVEGFHQWDEALEEVDFLAYKHRHLFQIRVHINVNHNNRDKEIFIETENIKFFLSEQYGSPCQFGSMSCEDIAEEILEFGIEEGIVKVEVYEDGKGGAYIELNDL